MVGEMMNTEESRSRWAMDPGVIYQWIAETKKKNLLLALSINPIKIIY